MRAPIAALLVALAVATPAAAGTIKPWDAAAFAEAQAADTPILIHVTAGWCPTCHAQTPVVSSLAADPANPDLVVFDVDFDSQKDILRRFNVRAQSTMIAFHGADERARAVGVTDPAAITALVAETR